MGHLTQALDLPWTALNNASFDFKIRWQIQVPETLAEAKRLVAETDPDQMTELPDGYTYLDVPSEYAGIAQRWLVV